MFTAKPAPTAPSQNAFACAQLAPTVLSTALSNDPSGFPGTSISQSDAKGYYNKGLGKCFVLISFTENAPKANGINYYKLFKYGYSLFYKNFE